jgi:hypothetical protein
MNDDAIAQFRAQVVRLSEAYGRVFGPGRATPEDKQLVLADLETVCNGRGGIMRSSPHETAYQVGKNEVWQRIHNMRFPRPADARRAEFRVTVERKGGLSHEQDQSESQGRAPQAGRGIEDPTDD